MRAPQAFPEGVAARLVRKLIVRRGPSDLVSVPRRNHPCPMPLGGVAAGIVLLLLGTFLSTFGPSLSDFGHGVRAPSGEPLRGSGAAPAETASTAGGNLPHQPAPTTPVANRSSVDLGQAVNFSVNANGGVPPYTYSWYGLPLPCNSTSAPVVACSPTVAANYQVYANVSDSFAVNGTSPTLSFTVFPDPGLSVAANVTSLELGRSVAFTATATGGTGSYVSYSWVPSVPQLGCPSSSGPTVVCTPTSSGSGWTIAASVSDSNGITSSPSSSPAIQVVGPLSVGAPTSNRSGADRGQSVQFTVVASGGSAPYSVSWNGLPSGCVTANVSTLPCVLTGTGTSSITVTVRDAAGVVASSPALPFIVAIDPTVGSPTASPPMVDQGGSSTLAVAATGGTGTLLYLWQGLPSSCPSRQATILCTFSSLGGWTVNVTVTDAAGYSVVSSRLTLLAVALPTVNVSASKVLIDLGQSLTFLTLVHGGVPNFTYSWSGLPCGGTLVGASTITCVPTATGAYNVSVSIVDATGAAATSRPVQLSVAVPPSIAGFNATAYQVPVGGTSTFTVAAQGGAGPLHYTYSGLPRGCTTQNVASFTCVFQHQGNFTVRVVVSDAVGAAVSANLTVHATGGAPRSTVPPPPPLGFVALLLGLSLIAVTTVLGLAFVLFRGARLQYAPPLNGFTGLQRGRPPWVAPDTNPRRADPRGLPRPGPDGGVSGPPPRSEPYRRV